MDRIKVFAIFRFVIVFLLIAGFAWQVRDSVDKFLAKKTTIASRD
jgi:hypothetical protein